MRTLHGLLVHGAGGGAWQWSQWSPVLAEAGIQGRALDLRPAETGLAATRFADYLAQLRQALRTLPEGEGPPFVIGASLGGLLAAKLAEDAPLGALVLVNPAPPAGVDDWAYRARRYEAIIDWTGGIELEATRRAMPEADPEVQRRAHAQWRDESGAVMNAVCAGIEVAPPPMPCLVLCGEADTAMPPAVCAGTAAHLSAERRSFAGVSHVGALLGPAAPSLAAVAAHWLRARLQGPAP
jgi:pimeloyl-ACP methyl ester carboxylesterase